MELVDCEKVMTKDLTTLNTYFQRWRLKPNPNKTEVCAFHLNNKQASKTLDIRFDHVQLNHNFTPKYLGITLDRTLSFKKHIENTAKKVKSRVNLIQKLAGTGWGANAITLRTATMAIVYSTAEYGSPVWINSAHVTRIDSELNNAMRIISGTVKTTQTPWLPVLTNIIPPHIRRKEALVNTVTSCLNYKKSLLFQMLREKPINRLKSRNAPGLTAENLINTQFCSNKSWNEEWAKAHVTNKDLITRPGQNMEGMLLPRKQWSTINRIRTGQGRCGSLLFKWRYKDSAACDCGEVEQTMKHIVESCPRRLFEQGIVGIHQVTKEAVEWLKELDLDL
jgi:hypothetical protein